ARQRAPVAHTITPWRGWFDGSAHPNPGRCGIGALLLGPAGERREIAQAAGYGNSSEAEYLALIALLETAVAAQAHGLTIYGDSRVVIDDMHVPAAQSLRHLHAAAQSLRHLHAAAHALMAQLTDVRLRWIPRHKNGAADALSQRGSAMHHEAPDVC
ncbi:MAG: ribonuclease HI family protein, partial [Pseudomonadota bacterium]|nr:ribonuclease HI family protein [Pseudomonadota bacterium]